MKSGILGVFQTLDGTLAAIRRLQETGIRPTKVYSPTRVEEITDLLGMKPSPVRYFTLVGGITGILFGYGLATFAASRWGFIVWGKHPGVFIPYVIPAFEFCILFSVFATLIGMAIHARLPRIRLPEEYDARFSRDHFGIAVRIGADGKTKIEEILLGAGAVEVREFGPEVRYQENR
jgi:hypothetical protein